MVLRCVTTRNVERTEIMTQAMLIQPPPLTTTPRATLPFVAFALAQNLIILKALFRKKYSSLFLE